MLRNRSVIDLDPSLQNAIRDIRSAEVELAILCHQTLCSGSWIEQGFKSVNMFAKAHGLTLTTVQSWFETLEFYQQQGVPFTVLKPLGMGVLQTIRKKEVGARLKDNGLFKLFVEELACETPATLNLERMREIEDEIPRRQFYASNSVARTAGKTPSNTQSVTPRSEKQNRDQVLSSLVSQVLLGKNRFPPRPEGFMVSEKIWQQLSYAVNLEIPLLITGPAGCGKTELVRLHAEAMGRPLECFNFGAMSDPRTSVVGMTQFSPEHGTYFSPSRFVGALQNPKTVLLLDEFNRCPADASNLLLSIMDGQKYLSLDESKSVVSVAAGVSFIATANIGSEYVDTNAIDRAVKDRFGIVIELDFPTHDEEVALLQRRHRGLNPVDVKRLVNLANHQRRLAANGEFEWKISTRMLLSTALQLSFGISMKSAVEFTISNHFSKEGDDLSDRKRFLQLLQKYV